VRTILFHCFGLKSTSIHPGEFRSNAAAGQYAGHIERGEDGVVDFGDQVIRPIKTHGRPQGPGKAIYVVRDGRDAIGSLSAYYNHRTPLATLIEGRHMFGTWAGHLRVWEPEARPDTLVIRYEDLVGDLPGSIDRIAYFLETRPVSLALPPREVLADGHYVRAETASKPVLSGDDLELFWRINGEAMRRYGYGDALEQAVLRQGAKGA
jgi:hypothetical protein